MKHRIDRSQEGNYRHKQVKDGIFVPSVWININRRKESVLTETLIQCLFSTL